MERQLLARDGDQLAAEPTRRTKARNPSADRGRSVGVGAGLDRRHDEVVAAFAHLRLEPIDVVGIGRTAGQEDHLAVLDVFARLDCRPHVADLESLRRRLERQLVVIADRTLVTAPRGEGDEGKEHVDGLRCGRHRRPLLSQPLAPAAWVATG